ncbi:MAG: sigma-70 family RNA polymerase sigma factor [Rhodococcus sp. (in: high G+C Gram-positive bacteria)]
MTITADSTVVAEACRGAETDERSLCRELLERIVQQDEDALAALMVLTHHFVFGAVLRILGDRARTEEAVQEIFVQIWNTAELFDADRGSPHAWMMTLARRRAIDRVRSDTASSKRDTAYHAAHYHREHDEVFEAVSVTLDADTVARALGELTALQRAAIELIYFRGLSYREAGRRLGVPQATVKTRVRDGILRLRTHLG